MISGLNKVELLGTYGGDTTHALSAWTSTLRDLSPAKLKRRAKLLSDLCLAGHHSVYEKSALHFLVTTDIATHIHLLKHRVGVSINAESARYKELTDKGYLPQDWPDTEVDLLSMHLDSCFSRYHACVSRLEAAGVDRKRAKESARFYLCYGTQITSDVMFNWRSFWHFLTLRYHEAAQVEVRDLARQMIELVSNVGGLESTGFDETLAAFNLTRMNNGLVEIREPFTKKDFAFVPDFA